MRKRESPRRSTILIVLTSLGRVLAVMANLDFVGSATSFVLPHPKVVIVRVIVMLW